MATQDQGLFLVRGVHSEYKYLASSIGEAIANYMLLEKAVYADVMDSLISMTEGYD